MIDRLTLTNPWWIDRATISQDPHLRACNAAPVRWTPRLATEVDLTHPAVFTLRGPRQVGKTTTLKLLLARSLREAPDEEVLFYSCDLDTDPDVIREAVQAARRFRPQARRWRIFLDEVTSIRDWQRGVKWLWDNSPSREDTFVVTGSSAIDIAAGADRLPGRRGAATRPDRILLPLSFLDFARVHGLQPPAEIRLQDFFKPAGRGLLTQAGVHLPTLQTLLERYLRSGGFPAAVIDEHATGTVSEQSLRTLWDMIENEVSRQRRDPIRAYRTVEHTARALGHLTDWTALAETLDTDRRTAEAYARAMALMFSIVILHKYELDRGGANLRAQKKLYFVDPLLAYIPHRIRRVGLEPELPALVENAVIMALFRSEERPLAEEFALPQALFYWRSKSGGEVDALGGSGPIAGRVPVEVKYRRTISARDLAALTRSFERGIVVTAETLDLSDPLFPRVPAALFLWVLGGEHVAPVTSSEITHV